MTGTVERGLPLLIILLAALALPGCSVISRAEPLQVVALSAYTPQEALCQRAGAGQIVVPLPYASAGLATERIAILKDERNVHYMDGLKWEDTNAGLVQRRLVDVLNDSRCFAGVGTGSMALRADYRLEVDIKRMHLVYGKDEKRPAAEVSLLLRLVEVKSGSMAGQYNAFARQVCGDDLFAAMEAALNAAAQSSLEWVRASLSK